jgi:hypothetical protein
VGGEEAKRYFSIEAMLQVAKDITQLFRLFPKVLYYYSSRASSMLKRNRVHRIGGYAILVMKIDTLRCSAIQQEGERSVSQQEPQPYDSALKSFSVNMINL